MPVTSVCLASGTRITVRPSWPRTTVTSRSKAARCLVPRSAGFDAVREGIERATPPWSTTWMLAWSAATEPSIRYRV